MVLKVDKKEKKRIAKTVTRKSKGLNVLRILSLVFLFTGLFGGALYCAINFSIPELNVVNVQGVPTKDISSIVTNTILIVVLGGIFYLWTRAVLWGLLGRDIGERINEVLELLPEGVRYVFTLRHPLHRQNSNSSVVIWIPYNNIRRVRYDAELHKTTIYGKISSEWVENGELLTRENPSHEDLDCFVIYDYFEPKFATSLRERTNSLQ